MTDQGNAASVRDVRPWVKRLGSYLRIFGPPAVGTFGYRTVDPYLDSLIDMAQRKEGTDGDA